MIHVTTLPIMRRRGVRRYAPIHQGALLSGLLILWRCGHAHDTKLEAHQCAEHEARQRGLPVPFEAVCN